MQPNQPLIRLRPELLRTLIQVQRAVNRALDDEDHVLVSSDGVVDSAIAPILTRYGWTGSEYRAVFYSALTALLDVPVDGEEGADVQSDNVTLVNHPPDDLVEPLKQFRRGCHMVNMRRVAEP